MHEQTRTIYMIISHRTCSLGCLSVGLIWKQPVTWLSEICEESWNWKRRKYPVPVSEILSSIIIFCNVGRCISDQVSYNHQSRFKFYTGLLVCREWPHHYPQLAWVKRQKPTARQLHGYKWEVVDSGSLLMTSMLAKTLLDTVGSHLSEHVGNRGCSNNWNVQITEVWQMVYTWHKLHTWVSSITRVELLMCCCHQCAIHPLNYWTLHM